jgi:hypothetical protein
MEGQTPPPAFVEVAIVQAVGHGWNANLAEVINGLRFEAARLGCDIVIHVRVDQGGSTTSGTGIAGRAAGAPQPWPAPQPQPQPQPAPAATPAPATAWPAVPTAWPATAAPAEPGPATVP